MSPQPDVRVRVFDRSRCVLCRFARGAFLGFQRDFLGLCRCALRCVGIE